MSNCQRFVGLGAVVFLVSCGAEKDPQEAMTGKVTSLFSELAELEEAAEAHDDAVKAATELVAINTEETSYNTYSTARHTEMDHALDEMSACRREGAGPDTEEAAASLENVTVEITTHATNMDAAADIAAAKEEEERHQAALAAIVIQLQAEKSELEGSAADFMCDVDDHGNEEPHADE